MSHGKSSCSFASWRQVKIRRGPAAGRRGAALSLEDQRAYYSRTLKRAYPRWQTGKTRCHFVHVSSSRCGVFLALYAGGRRVDGNDQGTDWNQYVVTSRQTHRLRRHVTRFAAVSMKTESATSIVTDRCSIIRRTCQRCHAGSLMTHLDIRMRRRCETARTVTSMECHSKLSSLKTVKLLHKTVYLLESPLITTSI